MERSGQKLNGKMFEDFPVMPFGSILIDSSSASLGGGGFEKEILN